MLDLGKLANISLLHLPGGVDAGYPNIQVPTKVGVPVGVGVGVEIGVRGKRRRIQRPAGRRWRLGWGWGEAMHTQTCEVEVVRCVQETP